MLHRTCAFTKNLSLLICQIMSFKSGKLSLRKKINSESQVRYPSKNEHNARETHIAWKKQSNKNFS